MARSTGRWLSMLVSGLAMAGCSGSHADGDRNGTNSERVSPGETVPGVTLPERVPAPPPPVTGEAPPDLLQRIRQDLVLRTGADPSALHVVRDQSVTWNDGSLGCPEQGQEYLQVLVPGYWIVITINGREYDYRCDAKGQFRLCENPVGAPSAMGSAGTSSR